MAKMGDFSREKGPHGAVKGRLLDEAERLFAERGYKQTSIRRLAAAAGCNVASVNYYFGDKNNLYRQVWKRVLTRLTEVRLASIREVMAGDSPPALEQLLRSFAMAFIGPLTGEKSGHLVKLMAREMFDEVLPRELFVDEVIKPTMAAMGDAIVKTCPRADRARVPLLIFSIIGQLIHAVRVKGMFEYAGAPDVLKLDVAEAVEHIVEFSAAGIRACEGRAG
jgi:AcrR family transcriptional regulator